MIRDLRSRGCYIKDIANKLNVCSKTISRALKRQGPPPKRKAGVRVSKLDGYKARVDELLADDIWNAEVIFDIIRNEGYTGSRTLLRGYIHPKRTLREPLATTRFETAPGHQLQHDWGEVNVEIEGRLTRNYSKTAAKPARQSTCRFFNQACQPRKQPAAC